MTMNIEQLIEKYDQKLQESLKREEGLISAYNSLYEKYNLLKTDETLLYKHATNEISTLTALAQQKISMLYETAAQDKVENARTIATYNYHMQEINASISANGNLTQIGNSIDSLLRRLDTTDGQFKTLTNTMGTHIQAHLGPISNIVYSVKDSINDMGNKMATRYDNNTSALHYMKDAFDRHATRELIVDMSGIKPQIVYDSVIPTETELNASVIADMLKKPQSKLVEKAYSQDNTFSFSIDEEEHVAETRIVEREIESVDRKGRVTSSTITVEEEVPREEQAEREEVISFTPNDDNTRGILKNTLVLPTLNTVKPRPAQPVRIVPVNMTSYISSTLTPEYIGINFYRKDLSTMVGINNLQDHVKKEAVSKMCTWLRNNINKDINGWTGSNHTGYQKIRRNIALPFALANYKLITGEDYAKKIRGA